LLGLVWFGPVPFGLPQGMAAGVRRMALIPASPPMRAKSQREIVVDPDESSDCPDTWARLLPRPAMQCLRH